MQLNIRIFRVWDGIPAVAIFDGRIGLALPLRGPRRWIGIKNHGGLWEVHCANDFEQVLQCYPHYKRKLRRLKEQLEKLLEDEKLHKLVFATLI